VERLRGKLGWLAVGLLVGSLCTGVAVAKIVIPPHSVSCGSLTKGLQKRICLAGPLGRVGPRGEKGEAGLTGPVGPQGETGEAGPMGTEGESAIETPSAFGLVSPWGPEEDPLSRSSNAKLIDPDAGPEGIWCIEPDAVDPANMLVRLTPADEPHFTAGSWEIPVARWHVVATVCDANQAEVETAIFDTLEGEYIRTNMLPFTFYIEEGG